jgi:hypothetical protein
LSGSQFKAPGSAGGYLLASFVDERSPDIDESVSEEGAARLRIHQVRERDAELTEKKGRVCCRFTEYSRAKSADLTLKPSMEVWAQASAKFTIYVLCLSANPTSRRALKSYRLFAPIATVCSIERVLLSPHNCSQ